MYRKLSLLLLAIILPVLAVLLLAPYLLKDRFTSSLEDFIDEKSEFNVTFSSRLSFARHFPNLSLILDDVVVKDGANVVAQAEHIDIIMGLSSVIKSKGLSYKEVAVSGGYVNYPFPKSGVEVKLFRVDLSLKGEYAEEIFPAMINFEVGKLFLTKDSVIYLDGVELSSKLEVEIDTKNMRAILGENLIDINGLGIIVDGEIGYFNTGIDLNILFNTENEEMPVLIGALVPSAFVGQFKGTGMVSVDGSIVGPIANTMGIHPEVLLKIDLKDGGLAYIDGHGDLLELGATGSLDVQPKVDSISIKYALDSLAISGIVATDVNGSSLVSDHSISLNGCTFGIFDGYASVNGLLETEHGKNPLLNAKMVFKDIDLASSIEELTVIRKYLPAEKEINGIVDLTVDFKGRLGEDYSLVPETVEGNGRVISDSIMVDESVAFDKMKTLLQLGDNYTSTFHGIDIIFSVSSGRMFVEPFTTSVGNLKLTVSGNHSIDNTLNYLVKTEMPRSDLGGQINSLINLFSGSLSALGLKVPIEESIKMDIKITGSFGKPVITPLF